MTYGTMEKIQTVTVGSGGAATIEFTNIPQTYDDLYVLISARSSRIGTVDLIFANFNNSSANLSDRELGGTGASVYSTTGTNGRIGAIPTSSNPANTFSNTFLYITNYRSASNKSFSTDSVQENNAADSYATLHANLWSNTAAITAIKLLPQVGPNFTQHSSATLYGITRVPAGAKATGGVIYDDSSYWYHVFTSSGTFTPSQNITCDYLVVAGGGGGGNHHGGGGGAGGLRSTVTATGGGGSLETALSLIGSTNYTVTIGAGGAGAATNNVRGTAGSNTVFSTITSTGGGGGGSRLTENNGGNGGSGGGAGYLGTGGTGTANQGRNGGNDTTGTINAGGGGGGASTAGSNSGPTPAVGGNGGDGVTISALSTPTFTGASNAYAGGGGGGGQSSASPTGAGGLGGGGNGRNNTVGLPATINTGGGGGGGGWDGSSYAGGAGGSGIVIIRYTK